MNEQVPETPLEETEMPQISDDAPAQAQPTGESTDSSAMIAITAILALAVVTSCCILSCALITFAFFTNAPW